MTGPKISIICALTSGEQVIGHNQKLPWNLPKDLQFFRATTLGKPVIMGRKTYESIGRPLPKRTNIVVSRGPRPSELPEQVRWVGSLAEALSLCVQEPECFVIGGEQIFAEALPHAHTLYLTWVDESFEDDVCFPAIPWEQFRLIKEQKDADDGVSLRFCTYERAC